MKVTHSDTYAIRSYEADIHGKASLPAICNLMQESAWKHAHAMELGFEHLMDRNQAWVLSRLMLEINDLPEWREEIHLATWARGIHRLFALRDFLITGRETYIRATSSWLVIDLETRRPKRIEDLMDRMVSFEEKSACSRNADKIGPFPILHKQRERTVLYKAHGRSWR